MLLLNNGTSRIRRLLVYFKYLGTNYKGIQLVKSRRTDKNRTIIPEFESIQGVLEFALRKVLQLDSVNVINSSRTDAGVHALSSTVHFDVDADAFKIFPFNTETICQSLNYFLENSQTDIRVQRIVEVPTDFHCRRAQSRTYTYRIALAKANDFDNCFSLMKLTGFLPITELNKAQVVPQPFDVQAVQQACRLFLGTWNFRSFATLSRDIKYQLKHPEENSNNFRLVTEDDLIKTIYRFSLSKVRIEDEGFDVYDYYTRDSSYNKLQLYDFHVEGSGFLRRQVRRMIGLLLSVGRGTSSPKDILHLLQNPSEKTWPSHIRIVNGEGLYLKSVNYKNVQVLRGPLS